MSSSASVMNPSNEMGISVVIPTHNRAHLILRAVQSALAAIGSEDEVIVVDDGSTDETQGALAPVRDRIHYIQIEQSGAGRARNVGIESATKPLIAFLDSDDAWLPFKLELQRAVMSEHPELVFCCSNFSLCIPERDIPSYLERWWASGADSATVFGEGTVFRSPIPLVNGMPTCGLHVCDLYEPLLHDGVVCLITLVYRRDRAPNLRFPEDLPTYEDWEFSARLARCGPGAYLDCDTAINYGHDGPRLTDANRLTCATTRLKVMPRLWGKDREFLAKHQQEYEQVCAEQRLQAATWLIRHGRGSEAWDFLREVADVPLGTRLLAALPIPKAAVDMARRSMAILREALGSRKRLHTKASVQ